MARRISLVWNNLFDIREENESGEASWFKERVGRIIGNDTSFWCDPWLGGDARVFYLGVFLNYVLVWGITIAEKRR